METLNISQQEDGRYSVGIDMPGKHSVEVKNVICLMPFGSTLYGTSTPESDLDYKGVFMADLSDIILGKDSRTFNLSSGGSEGNTSEDVDVEFIELRKFLKDAASGQSYALEMLFAPTTLAHPLWDSVRANRDKLVTSNVKPFIGYCIGQAKKYGLKGSRLKATLNALETLKSMPPKAKIEYLKGVIEENEYVFFFKQEGGPRIEELLEINSKKFNMSNRVSEAVEVVERLAAKYGNRSQQSLNGTDWKAVGHAFRCISQAKELLTTGELQFPRPDREFLLTIRNGEVPYEDVQDMLPDLVEEIDLIESHLPEKPDRDFWDHFILDAYMP